MLLWIRHIDLTKLSPYTMLVMLNPKGLIVNTLMFWCMCSVPCSSLLMSPPTHTRILHALICWACMYRLNPNTGVRDKSSRFLHSYSASFSYSLPVSPLKVVPSAMNGRPPVRGLVRRKSASQVRHYDGRSDLSAMGSFCFPLYNCSGFYRCSVYVDV